MSGIRLGAIQGTPEWHAARRLGVGSSDAPILTGDAPWGDVLSLYAAKTGIIDPPDIETAQTAWGRKLEAVVADWFTEHTGKKLRRVNQILRHPEHEWMLASLDRVVVGERMVCEVKTRRFPNDEWGPEGTAEIPAHYLVQTQHQIAVGGFDGAYLAVLFAGSDPRLYQIPRDDELIAALIELEGDFMQCVRTGTPPEQLIRKQRPVVAFREGEIVADDKLALGIEGVFNLRQEIKAREADLALASEAVKTLLGPNTAARAGVYRATFKQGADSHPVRWDLVAAAFRKWIEGVYASGDLTTPLDRIAATNERPDLDAIESLFTDLTPGKRPLLIRRLEEATAA